MSPFSQKGNNVKFDSKNNHRKSIRLKGYDYSQAEAYFVTIVTYRREYLFGDVVGGEMRGNTLGKIVQECWNEIPAHFPNVEVDAFVAMPNHVHGIIIIHPVGAQHAAPLPAPLTQPQLPHVKPGSLAAIVRSLKSPVTRRAGRELIRVTSGSEISTNISFEIKTITTASPVTSSITHPTGIRTKRIPKTSVSISPQIPS